MLTDILKAAAGEVMLLFRAASCVNCRAFGMAAATIDPSEDKTKSSIGRPETIVSVNV